MEKNKTAYLIIFIVTIAYSDYFAQGFWEQIQSPVNKTLLNVFFADSLLGWAAGESGTVIRTTDGGTNWINSGSNTDTTIWSVHFFNDELGWMVSWLDDSSYNGTLIHKTTNGGEDWKTYEFPQALTYIEDIYFIDSLIGFAGVSYSTIRGPIYYTTNGGINWSLADVQPDTLNYPFLPVKRFYRSGHALFACGGAIDIAGVIWRSFDNGLTWKADSTVAPDPINELYFFDSLNVLGIGGDRELLYGIGMIKTTTGGNFWEYSELQILGVANSMDFRTPAEGWSSLGSIQSFIFTTDSGFNWKEVSTPANAEINDIIFIDSTKGFAVGKDGVILQYIYEPGSVEDNPEDQPQEFYLYQNYPNPFNPITTLSFVISSASGGSFVSLKVYDVLGKEVAALINQVLSEGSYEIEFSPKDLPSGIYFYKLSAGSFTQTKKMVLIR